MTHTKILELIENVDVNDSAALDEIDARVWCYLEKLSFLDMGSTLGNQDFYCGTNNHDFIDEFSGTKYTRSRDALKAIRPEGWIWYAATNKGIHSFVYHQGEHEFLGELHNSTEELAELSAIIQAIAHERNEG